VARLRSGRRRARVGTQSGAGRGARRARRGRFEPGALPQRVRDGEESSRAECQPRRRYGQPRFCYAMVGQYDEVARWSEYAMLLDPVQGINKALAYAILGLDAPSQATLQRARALRPDYPHTQLVAVHMQLLAGRAAEAVETAERSADAHPNVAAMAAYAGEAHLFARHMEHARAYLEQARAMSPLARGISHHVWGTGEYVGPTRMRNG
jgi:tetratricopeptide (TPR) repeat protein